MLSNNLGWLRKSLLSEAPSDEQPAEDYQLDDEEAPTDEGDDTGTEDTGAETTDDESGTDTEADDSDGDDYQLDSGDSGENPDETADTDNPDEMENPEDADVDDDEKLKKLILLGQFKELVSLTNNLSTSINNLERDEQYINNIHYEYLQDKMEELKSKLNFTITAKFIKSDYTELLKLFHYFKFNLNDLAKLTENLIKE